MVFDLVNAHTMGHHGREFPFPGWALELEGVLARFATDPGTGLAAPIGGAGMRPRATRDPTNGGVTPRRSGHDTVQQGRRFFARRSRLRRAHPWWCGRPQAAVWELTVVTFDDAGEIAPGGPASGSNGAGSVKAFGRVRALRALVVAGLRSGLTD